MSKFISAAAVSL